MTYFSLENIYLKKLFPDFVLFVTYFKNLFATNLKYITVNNNGINLYLNEFKLDVFFFLKKHHLFQYKQLVDLIVVDKITKTHRFMLIYTFLSVKYNFRVTVYSSLNELQPIPTLTKIYASASWSEREVWDLFGIFFSENVDLRRLLTDYGFDGHPLRKDFPLTGFVELFFNDSKQSLYYTPVTLTQEYRNFVFINPWLK